MEKNKTENILTGALLLTLAGLFSKVLSAAYRIPLQNLTGDLGFFVYQQIYPIIGIIMILSLYGFPVAISTLVVNQKQKGYQLTYQSFYIPLLIILFIMNGLVFAGLFFGAPFIADWTGMSDLESAFKMIAIAFLGLPLLAILRGNFQGQEEMKQTATSQIVEQFIRVVIIITASILVFTDQLDVYNMAEVGASATIIGMVFAIIVLIWLTIRQQETVEGKKMPTIPWLYYAKVCFSLGVVAAMIHMILLITQLADVLTLVPNLIKFGLSPIKAMEMKGIFDRGQPLIQFGAVIGSSFSLALIPTIHKLKHAKTFSISESIGGALALSFYVAVGATIGLIILFPEVNMLLFKTDDGTSSLQILVMAILLSSLSITACTILQSLGYIKTMAVSILGTFIIKYSLNQLLVPFMGITGAAIATVVSLLLLCVTLLLLLYIKVSQFRLFTFVNMHVLSLASIGMIVYLFIIKYSMTWLIIPSRFALLLYVLFAVTTGGLLYISLLFRYNAFTEQQIATLPYSRYMVDLAQFIRKK